MVELLKLAGALVMKAFGHDGLRVDEVKSHESKPLTLEEEVLADSTRRRQLAQEAIKTSHAVEPVDTTTRDISFKKDDHFTVPQGMSREVFLMLMKNPRITQKKIDDYAKRYN